MSGDRNGPTRSPCLHCSAEDALLWPPLGNWSRYSCPTCGDYRVSGTTEAELQMPERESRFRTDARGVRWLEADRGSVRPAARLSTMVFRIVNRAGVRGYLTSTYAATGKAGDDLRLVHLHAEDGELMPGQPNPILPPVAPEDVERRGQEWALQNGWSRVPDEE